MDDMTEDQLHNFGVEGILTNEEIMERKIITSPADNILTGIVFTKLNSEVPFEAKPESYGINNFIKTKKIIALFV